jgi:hypothetical protein
VVTGSITNEAAEELKLAAGQTACAVIKASDVMVGVDDQDFFCPQIRLLKLGKLCHIRYIQLDIACNGDAFQPFA